MRVDLFDFELPQDLIAQRPVSPRDAARLLDVAPDGLHDRGVRDLPKLLRKGDLLVFNDTKVIPARLLGTRPGGGKVEALLIRDLGAGHWLSFARPTKRLQIGDALAFAGGLGATVAAKNEDGSVVLVFDRGGHDFLTALEQGGAVPLPPYIRGGTADARDRADYQTLFAKVDGSVAAPTAGLHFTPALMAALAEAGVTTAGVTLHVGAGTFQPVRVDDTDRHVMHSEWGEVPQATAQAIAAAGRVVSIGTTSLRLLESVARTGPMRAWTGETDIFITPGFQFRAVDLLLTNFHLPRSTLFMLVAAFAGLERVKEAYAHAVSERYRFYSYGDCCLLRR
ncbi:MAG: tRNA preQ1(34) S-adenosylmethionine ribosyltransferase-isomerase QueA [Reyranella sp.]|uniref:tRNA preQ1(34) S-adenosylmethionine ribosyltransferase-isomerase QueA n=1 Tax=Reyranella sp. TaxID=1929291 RepID=UPI00122A60EE|nr:tRNA preQ1(34) S-adenosylmethionine ribosyltransferase-isomerase QueA [Reyranella sp.]TAJ42577.1 MAG: tRNA preQ1(34) S-adenosylmethionine ribosyltransferase-isomerase QueA [Reyranella sp.]